MPNKSCTDFKLITPFECCELCHSDPSARVHEITHEGVDYILCCNGAKAWIRLVHPEWLEGSAWQLP